MKRYTINDTRSATVFVLTPLPGDTGAYLYERKTPDRDPVNRIISKLDALTLVRQARRATPILLVQEG